MSATINHTNPNVTQVAAALADAAHAGGLSAAYYRAADDALARLAAQLDEARAQNERLRQAMAKQAEWLQRVQMTGNYDGVDGAARALRAALETA